MVNPLFLFVQLSLFVLSCLSPKAEPPAPEYEITQKEVEVQLRFLASDALRGRRTGSEGNNIAASYIASHLEAYGYESPEGAEGFFQPVPMLELKPASETQFSIHKAPFKIGEDFVVVSGSAANLKAEAVFAAYGWVDKEKGTDDYAGLDVKGKIVFVLSGLAEQTDRGALMNMITVKQRLAQERGALALVELHRLNMPWEFVRRNFNREQLRIADPNEKLAVAGGIPHLWMKDISKEELFQRIRKGKKTVVELSYSGNGRRLVKAQNVIGILKGSDPVLNKEYVLISAHYDHVGVGRQGGAAFTEKDSIFNGARDNAMGTVALLSAARALALERPKRSVIILAVTAEELGLLGSNYYASNPLVPLEQTIFNLNSDGAGYNDKRYVSIIGFGRTGTDDHVRKSAAAVGLDVFPDPAPEQNLFDRSDNYSFARKGVPAMNYSPGLTAFDESVAKYYHQVADEADSVDMAYLLKFCQAFANLARRIADADEKPRWKSGDKYEEAGRKLYEKK